jgi:ArsR family transcriptional regulator, arsenate/arsenite/antimonite-responsive transcriptional repressor
MATRTDIMFRAFSDQTRLRILYLLQDGECCVGDLVAILGIEQPSASRHLAYLRRAGLASVRKAGTWGFYQLAPATSPFHAKLLECLTCCFAQVPQIRRDQARARKLRQRGGCCPGEVSPSPATHASRVRPAEGSECCTAP